MIPASIFVFSGKGPENRKIRKCGYTCCACYPLLSFQFPYTLTTIWRVQNGLPPIISAKKKRCNHRLITTLLHTYSVVWAVICPRFRLPQFLLPWQTRSASLYRSYCSAAYPVGGAGWISQRHCPKKRIDLPKYDTG